MENKLDIVVLAAGVGSRFGKDIPKQFHEINGVPVFIKCIQNIYKSGWVNKIIVVINKEYEKTYDNLFGKYNLDNIIKVYGGNHRLDSLKNGIMQVSTESVIVMEGARPFAPSSLYNQLIEHEGKNVIAVMKSTNTPYLIENGKLVKTISTNKIALSVTPKKYSLVDIKEILDTIDYSKNDEAELLVHKKLDFIYSPTTNIKITNPVDEFIANSIERGDYED